jgi:hypothetical protein
MRTLNRIGFWGWLVLITFGIVFRVESCVMKIPDTHTEFWWLYMVIIPVFMYMWFRDWSKLGMFDFRKF